MARRSGCEGVGRSGMAARRPGSPPHSAPRPRPRRLRAPRPHPSPRRRQPPSPQRPVHDAGPPPGRGRAGDGCARSPDEGPDTRRGSCAASACRHPAAPTRPGGRSGDGGPGAARRRGLVRRRPYGRDHPGRPVTGDVPGSLVQANVPGPRRRAGRRARRAGPPPGDINIVPQADPRPGRKRLASRCPRPWQRHAAGVNGAGVNVGIIDVFDAAPSRGSGDLPGGLAPLSFCRASGTNCGIFDYGSRHGNAVAEIVHDMAPGADCASYVQTTSDLRAAIDWLAGGRHHRQPLPGRTVRRSGQRHRPPRRRGRLRRHGASRSSTPPATPGPAATGAAAGRTPTATAS